jgi:hypothetical protein
MAGIHMIYIGSSGRIIKLLCPFSHRTKIMAPESTRRSKNRSQRTRNAIKSNVHEREKRNCRSPSDQCASLGAEHVFDEVSLVRKKKRNERKAERLRRADLSLMSGFPCPAQEVAAYQRHMRHSCAINQGRKRQTETRK